jgi:hypothetical protein
VTRRLSILVVVAVLATAGTGALLVVRERAKTEIEPTAPQTKELALVTVRTATRCCRRWSGAPGSARRVRW